MLARKRSTWVWAGEGYQVDFSTASLRRHWAFSAIQMHWTADLQFWRIKTSKKPAPQNPSFTFLFFPSAFHAHASRRPLRSSEIGATMAQANDSRRWWHHRDTPRRRTRAAKAARSTTMAPFAGHACTRGASRPRRCLLVHWWRALGKIHRRRLRWAHFLILGLGITIRHRLTYYLVSTCLAAVHALGSRYGRTGSAFWIASSSARAGGSMELFIYCSFWLAAFPLLERWGLLNLPPSFKPRESSCCYLVYG
jgi:hypothetical protein